MRRFAGSLRPDVWFKRRGAPFAWPWCVWVAAVGVSFLSGNLMAALYPAPQLMKSLCFTCQDDAVEPYQYWLTQHMQTMIQAAGLSPDAYHNSIVRAQQTKHKGRQVQRHRITFPTHNALMAFEQLLRDNIHLGPFTYLARRERTNQTKTAVAITLGIDGIPTDVVLLQSQTTRVSAPRPKPSVAPVDMATTSARMAIVIDDMGWDLSIAQDLLDLNIPLSFALMPQAPYQMQIAAEAQRHGYDVLLHLPMEPHDYPKVNPGKDALLSRMSPHELSVHLEAALRMLPTAIGVNNHMGSRLTEDEQAMHIVMSDLKQHDLFFLDSRTSSASQAYRIAREVGLKAAQRNVFLDHDMRPEQIMQQLKRLVDLAQTRGYAIGIGHPYPATLHALKQALPALHQAGITLVPVSHLVH